MTCVWDAYPDHLTLFSRETVATYINNDHGKVSVLASRWSCFQSL